MRIRRFVHKGLKEPYEDGNSRGVSHDALDKLRKMLSFLESMQDVEELRSLPSWRAHRLVGDREGTWSLYVTRNRRLTFRVDLSKGELRDLNLEDYH